MDVRIFVGTKARDSVGLDVHELLMKILTTIGKSFFQNDAQEKDGWIYGNLNGATTDDLAKLTTLGIQIEEVQPI